MNKNKIIKIVALGVAAILLLVGGIVALIQANKKDKPVEVQPLEYRLSADKTYYIVYGIGESTNPELVIPSSYQNLPVKEIAREAFKDCDLLTSLNGGENLTKIGAYAFQDCDNLAKVSLKKKLTGIGDYAFQATALTEINIPAGVSYIGGGVFYECASMTQIIVSESNTKYKSIDGNLYSKDGTELIQYAIGKTETSFTTPKTVKRIDLYAFSHSKLINVTISEGIKRIVFYAFLDCQNLTYVTIGKGIMSISEGAFSGCKALSSITFQGTVKEWNEVEIDEDWAENISTQKVVCSDGEFSI